ncbi:MAG: dienelactone hydrolase family protein [Acidimicrobiia bacterium]
MAALREGYDDVEIETIELRGTDGEPISAVHARTEGLPKCGVVLHPDIGGLRPLFVDLARRLATHGAAVCAPEPFARAQTSGIDLGSIDRRMAEVANLADDLQIGDLEAAADYLVVNDDVSTVAVLGFCMGGMYALKAAAAGRFDRAVAFYGMIRVPDGWRSPNLAEPLAAAATMCPTLAIFGEADPYTPLADIEALRAAWSGRSDCEIVVYPDAEHGFVHDPERDGHRAADAADAWDRVLAFLTLD